MAQNLGIPPENIFIAEIGSVIEYSDNTAKMVEPVPGGRILIDGLGVGDVGTTVLRDRKQLSQEGILIAVVTINKESRTIAIGPDVVTRGFIYVRDSEEIIEEVKSVIKDTIYRCQREDISQWSAIKTLLKDSIGNLLYTKTGRRPMIIPIIQEI